LRGKTDLRLSYTKKCGAFYMTTELSADLTHPVQSSHQDVPDISLKVENVTKIYRLYDNHIDRLKESINPFKKKYHWNFYALNNVSFKVKKGETVGIVGRNGSGKSTLLKIITGVLTPTSGGVIVNGTIAALLELGTGFNPELTGIENIYFSGTIMGFTKEDIDDRLDSILSFADIGEYARQPVKTYSSGMFVRLAFALAINVHPDILIIDEALSVGDELFQRKCFSRIEAIKNDGATILFVSHSTSTVNQLCDTAILLENGELLLEGEPRSVVKNYQRLIFSSPEDKPEIIRLIKEQHDVSPQLASHESERRNIESDLEKIELLGDFVSNLPQPDTVMYHSNGGEYIEYALENYGGKKVNIVPEGFTGLVRCKIYFDKDASNVIFGFHIKSVSGIELAGLSYPSQSQQADYLDVKCGDEVIINWPIQMRLTPGTYFLTFGVRSIDQPGFICRIVDALTIKVTERAGSPAFGIFDISDLQKAWINLGSRHEK
jgi:lipopolysaccharide transport system ATP-binding protein